MRFCRRLLGAFALLAITAGAPAAKAADSPLALTVRAPAGCPATRALHDEVLRLARIESEAPHRLDAEIHVQKRGAAAFSLTLSTQLDGVGGERRFEGNSCQSVIEAAALTLALMLNPEVEVSHGLAADEEPASSALSGAARPAPPSAQTERSSQPGPAPPPRREGAASPTQLRGTLAALAGVQAGTLPRASPELSAALGVSTRTLGGVLAASYVPAQDVRLSGQDAGGRLWAVSANLLGCWSTLAREGGGLGPCAGIEISRVQGRGLGVDEPNDGAIVWASAVVGLSAHLRLTTSFELRAGLWGLFPIERPEVFLDDIGQVHQPGRLTGRAQAGLAVELF